MINITILILLAAFLHITSEIMYDPKNANVYIIIITRSMIIFINIFIFYQLFMLFKIYKIL